MINRSRQNNFFLKRFVAGPLAVNCYLLADPVTHEACVIDPGGDPDKIKKEIDKNKFDLKFIINTHGHGDHIAVNSHFKVPIYIHRLDKDFLGDPGLNLSGQFMLPIRSPEAFRLLEDGDRIKLGGLTIEVIHTPGHTPGSISLGLDGVIFTGDTLFYSGVGRTDFTYGDESALYSSIEKLLRAVDDTVIYPGHGPESTIGRERQSFA